MTGTGSVTVGVKTFMRTDKLRQCLASLAPLPWAEVIVADDGQVDPEREELYASTAERLPLKVLRLPFDMGLSAGRNAIVRECATPYLLMLDDDQTVPADIGRLAEVLDFDPEVGGVSCVWLERGALKCSACDIHRDGRTIVKEVAAPPTIYAAPSGQRYAVFDFIPNSTLFRTACLREQMWDPYYKIGKEHLDFYLAQQRLGHWKFAVSMDVVIGHHPEGAPVAYSQFRHGERVKSSERYFLDKWGVTHVVEGRKFDAVCNEFGSVAAWRHPSRFARLVGRLRNRH